MNDFKARIEALNAEAERIKADLAKEIIPFLRDRHASELRQIQYKTEGLQRVVEYTESIERLTRTLDEHPDMVDTKRQAIECALWNARNQLRHEKACLGLPQ